MQKIPKLKTIFSGNLSQRDLKKSKCKIPISIGQHYHEDDKMFALLFDAAQTFGELEIAICDSLHEYTKKIGRILSVDTGYTHYLMSQKGVPEPSGKKRGCYLYKNIDERIYALIVHNQHTHETICLSDLLANGSSRDLLLEVLQWPKQEDAITTLDPRLVETITLECKRHLSESVKRVCIEEGHAWLAKYQTAIDQINIPTKVTHWSEWITHENYQTKKQQIETLYLEDEFFRRELNKVAMEFLENYTTNNPDVDLAAPSIVSEGFQLCVECLKEECAVKLLWADEDYHFLAYPAKCTSVLSYLKKNVISESKPGALEYLVLKFQDREKEVAAAADKTEKALPVPIKKFSYDPTYFGSSSQQQIEPDAFLYSTIRGIVESNIDVGQKQALIGFVINNLRGGQSQSDSPQESISASPAIIYSSPS